MIPKTGPHMDHTSDSANFFIRWIQKKLWTSISIGKIRHNKTQYNINTQTLSKTISGVVRNMKPAMICMYEVGEASIPLTEEHVEQVADQTMQALRDVATEHVELHCMFEVGAPYMTVYEVRQVQCSCHRILTHLYSARGEPRTAQAFLCSGPGGLTALST